MGEKLTKAQARLREHWHDFTQCDWWEEGFAEEMEAAGLIECRSVSEEDLDHPFAAELGIEAGGMVWDLTPAGRQALEDAGHG